MEAEEEEEEDSEVAEVAEVAVVVEVNLLLRSPQGSLLCLLAIHSYLSSSPLEFSFPILPGRGGGRGRW